MRVPHAIEPGKSRRTRTLGFQQISGMTELRFGSDENTWISADFEYDGASCQGRWSVERVSFDAWSISSSYKLATDLPPLDNSMLFGHD
jgi:hypothetical protein